MSTSLKRSLTVVLKTVERCNINCTYCYIFNQSDESWKNRPIYITTEVVKQTIKFLKQAVLDFNLDQLFIIFHGGEPMMQRQRDFDAMCHEFRTSLQPVVDCNLGIQTNAILMSNSWIKLLQKHQVSISISLDGPKEYNDKHRIDHYAKGTYDKVIRGIKMLQTEVEDACSKIGLLCVINPEYDAERIYNHFVHELKIKNIDFLLPEFSYDIKPSFNVDNIDLYLNKLLSCWLKDNDPEIKIRLFSHYMSLLQGKQGIKYGFTKLPENCLHIISITTDGSVTPTDEVRNIYKDQFFDGTTVFNASLKEFYNKPIFTELGLVHKIRPQKCESCIWQEVCQGGNYETRFSLENRFNNPTIHCESIKKILAALSACMIKHGYAAEKIMKNIGLYN